MAQKECPSCGLDVDTEEKVCHFCGYEFPERSSGFKLLALILAVLLLLVMMII